MPLPTLLSQALVAFTIEFDNEGERLMQHRTTRYGSKVSPLGPWLTSMVMWMNCLKFLGEKGLTARELENLARTHTNLHGMHRWGYIVIEPDPTDRRPKPPRSAWLIRATPGGRAAQEICRPLFDVIEKRWEDRFGKYAIDELRASLRAIVRQLDPALPDCMPILHYALFNKLLERPSAWAPTEADIARLPLPPLLSKVLLAFAIEFEREPHLSLAICANVLRVLNEKGERVRDLPVLAGVSKESISMAMGILRKKGLVEIQADTTARRTKLARLTPKGLEAQDAYRRHLSSIEERWLAQFGEDNIRGVRSALERLVGDPTAGPSRLLSGLEPHPDGWRASVRKPATLPHFPMVLHRGGYPDGA
ncbi:MAG TPA: hypothetical protein VJW94_12815 [Candidatus Acidoferrum sp.]|nr:hypothetical protein [Candidatus Acidoferrum sp.]